MVNVVDVEITKENFVKAFNREPNEAETAMMMKLKALRQEKQKALNVHSNLMDRSKKSQEIARKQAENRGLKTEVKATPRGIMINKMMNYGLSVQQVTDVLQLTDHQVQATVERYRLPRPISDLVRLK